MHDAGDVAQQGEEDVQPEGAAETHLQEHAQRRQDDGDEDADQVHAKAPWGSSLFLDRLIGPRKSSYTKRPQSFDRLLHEEKHTSRWRRTIPPK